MKGLPSHDSLMEYIDHLNKGESFKEASDDKLLKKSDDKACKVYSYQRIIERYIRKEGKPVEYQITAHVDDTKPIKHLLSLIRDGGSKYKRHGSYVGNSNNERCLWWKIHWAGRFTKSSHLTKAWGSICPFFQ